MIHLLSKAEDEVVRLKALGDSHKIIADKRCVSLDTIKTHVKRAIKKTGAKNGFELVARYVAHNPKLFQNLIVALFVSIQGLTIAPRITYVEQRKRKTVKITRIRQYKTQYIISA